MKIKKRIYVCHTFYHVYITYLREFYLPKEQQGHTTVLLSTMSTKFGDLKERLEEVGYFEQVLMYEEKVETEFENLMKYKKDTGNLIKNLWNRILFTKKLGKEEALFIPVDFREFEEVFIFCDSDPVGYYLNYKKIKYHALEDGLNCICNYDTAHFDNRGHFKLKAFMSAINLIFIQNGYGKYCIDMEVNDIDSIKYKCKKFVELPRKILSDRVTTQEKDIMLRSFVRDYDLLCKKVEEGKDAGNKVLILSEPLCALDVRKTIFDDIIKMAGSESLIFIKQHPRDLLDYEEFFPHVILLNRDFPMEMLNYIPKLHFDKVYSVFTELGALDFVDEKISLGKDFMDKYEDPLIHRQNEQIY